MTLRAKNKPHQYRRMLKQPMTLSILWFTAELIDSHYFCDGEGMSSMSALGADCAYDQWLESFRNPWWRRMLGAQPYSIETVEVLEPSIYRDCP